MRPRLPDQVHIEMDIMQGQKPDTQDFAGDEQMPQICPGKRAAGITRTGPINALLKIISMACVADIDFPLPGKERAVPGVSRREHA